jgi:hypothetical protein
MLATRSGTLIGLAVLGLALAATPAAAKKQGKVVTVTETASSVGVEQFTPVTATATCPKKRKLVGGGFAAGADREGGLFPVESHASGKRGWVATGLLSGEGDPSFSVHAYCRKGAPKLKQSSATVVLPAGAEEVGPDTPATASCSKPRKAVAGGFEIPPGTNAGGEARPGIVTSSSRSAKRDWSVSAQLIDAVGSTQLTAYVYCSKKKRGETSAAGQINVDETGEVAAPPCSKGTALAGGFQTPPLSGQSFLVPFASLRVGEQWATRAIQGEDGGTLTTYAYCS